MSINKSIEMLVLFFLVGLFIAIGNTVGYKIDVIDSLKGVLVIATIACVGYLISKIPLLNKLPLLFWVSVVAIYASTSFFPWSVEVLALTNKVKFLAVCTPILAYAGLAVGKDLEMFKKISWRIVPVALAVFTGTFLFAAVIAQFTLHWEGVIQ